MSEQSRKPAAAGPLGLAAQGIPISNPYNVSPVYANSIGAGGTLTDFTLHFLQIGQPLSGDKAGSAQQELKASVTLPLGIAEQLIQVLHQLIAKQKSVAEQTARAAKTSVQQ